MDQNNPTPATKPSPLMSDEKVLQYASQYVAPYSSEVKRACDHVREIYEQDRAKLLARIMELEVFGSKLLEYWDAGNFSQHPFQNELRELLPTPPDK